MMGVCTDKKIVEYILYDADDESRLSNEIWNILKESINKVSAEFEDVKNIRDQDVLLEYIGRLLTKKK